MRIIAGQLKGRRLEGPEGPGVRPTSDGLRETLFNVLGPRVIGARVLDAFAGTGAVGLEAISRGAVHATFVESDRRTAALLAQNVERCAVGEACMIVRDEFGRARLGRFDLVWLDPPYDTPDLDGVLARAGELIERGGLVVLEHSRRRESAARVGILGRTRTLVAGDSALSFYAPDE
jgi:16S rRNA (guanine(966)-N(2))-methyltransferase RsmD